jgi:hypothetical protein
MNEIQTTEPKGLARTATVADLVAHVNLIQEAMKKVMREGVHFGTIPGTGNRKVLFKTGAEKILELFRLAAEPSIIEQHTPDRVRYVVTVRLTHQITGAFIGAGIGECSSDEEKYKWKKAVVEEWNDTPQNMRREKWITPYNKKPFKVMQVRTQPADIDNTILKMAKKRGLIDATLTATAASDIFAHIDLEPEDIGLEQPAQEPDLIVTPKTPDPLVSDILQMLVEMNNGNEAAIADHLQVLTIYTDKDGKEKWLKVSDLEGVAKNKPEWMKNFHAELKSKYQKRRALK